MATPLDFSVSHIAFLSRKTMVAAAQDKTTPPPEDEDIELEWEEWDGKSPFLHHCIAGSIAGVAEHTLLYPIDTVKTHMQSYCADCPIPAAQAAAAQQGGGGGSAAPVRACVRNVAASATTAATTTTTTTRQSKIYSTVPPQHTVYAPTTTQTSSSVPAVPDMTTST
mmetsp:Transcript_3777/g.8499  ORF Transcript_3777/g.8499 Transcript_3777/m.8499 type:complete len:167 (+) Transcript_3777:15-515(+)